MGFGVVRIQIEGFLQFDFGSVGPADAFEDDGEGIVGARVGRVFRDAPGRGGNGHHGSLQFQINLAKSEPRIGQVWFERGGFLQRSPGGFMFGQLILDFAKIRKSGGVFRFQPEHGLPGTAGGLPLLGTHGGDGALHVRGGSEGGQGRGGGFLAKGSSGQQQH